MSTGKVMRGRASRMRKAMRPAERTAARLLIALAIPFKAQVVCGPYIADFIGLDRNFVLEIDGPIHQVQREYDSKRDVFFAAVGFQVIRVRNEDVSRATINAVVAKCQPWTKRDALSRIWMASLIADYWSPGDSVDALNRLHCGVSTPRAE